MKLKQVLVLRLLSMITLCFSCLSQHKFVLVKYIKSFFRVSTFCFQYLSVICSVHLKKMLCSLFWSTNKTGLTKICLFVKYFFKQCSYEIMFVIGCSCDTVISYLYIFTMLEIVFVFKIKFLLLYLLFVVSLILIELSYKVYCFQ